MNHEGLQNFMSLETIISTYGYSALIIGTFFEGETILILGGVVAHQGYLEPAWVVFCGFLGTFCGDQLYFYIGRAKGTKVLDKRPSWRSKSERVINLINGNQTLVILGFRFLYGMRTVTPFLLGAVGISPLRFLILNSFGALLWAVAIGISGYLFGNIFGLFIGDVKRYELSLFFFLAAIGAVVWCLYWLKAKQHPAREK